MAFCSSLSGNANLPLLNKKGVFILYFLFFIYIVFSDWYAELGAGYLIHQLCLQNLLRKEEVGIVISIMFLRCTTATNILVMRRTIILSLTLLS